MTIAAHILMSALVLTGAPDALSKQAGWPMAGQLQAATAAAARGRAEPRPGRSAASSVEAANSAALQEPQRDGFVDSVQVYPWTEGGIYRLYTAPGRITDIALQPGESLTAVAAGDTVRWIVGDTTSGTGADRRVHILLKPSAPGLSTNLVITTDRRIYRLEAKATERTAMAAVSWTYPGDALLALTGEGVKDSGFGADRARRAELFDFDYELSGDKPSWRPRHVFDDGRQVFIEFPPGFARDQAPPLFGIGNDGRNELLNYRIRGRFYVVDRLFDRAELRLGGKKQKVVRIEHREGKRR